MKQTQQLLAQFCTIIYIISEFNLDEKKTLLTQFWVLIYTRREFNFYGKNRNFMDSILDNNLHN